MTLNSAFVFSDSFKNELYDITFGLLFTLEILNKPVRVPSHKSSF